MTAIVLAPPSPSHRYRTLCNHTHVHTNPHMHTVTHMHTNTHVIYTSYICTFDTPCMHLLHITRTHTHTLLPLTSSQVQCGRGHSNPPARRLPSNRVQPSPTLPSHTSPLTACRCTPSHRSLPRHNRRSWDIKRMASSLTRVALGMADSF